MMTYYQIVKVWGHPQSLSHRLVWAGAARSRQDARERYAREVGITLPADAHESLHVYIIDEEGAEYLREILERREVRS